MKRWFRILLPMLLIGLFILGGLFLGAYSRETVQAKSEPGLALIASDYKEGMNILVYRYTNGNGSYYTFVVVGKNQNSGVAVSKLQ
jgi:hypothetical protein